MSTQNNQKYKESQSIVLNLEVLSMKYKNLLIQYKQAVADYINYLNSNKKTTTLTSKKGESFWGTGPAGDSATITNVSNVTACSTLCLQNSKCTGATFNNNSQGHPICWLRTGDGNPVPSRSTDYAILPTDKLMLLNIQSINTELSTVNQSILNKIKSSNSLFANQSTERTQNAQEMLKQYVQLNEERKKIENMVNDYETLDESQIKGNLKVSENYYSFLLLFLICACIIVVLFKISSNSNSSSTLQSGGDLVINGINVYYIIFAFILLFIFIYYYWYIANYTAGLLSTIGSFFYNTLRL